MFIMTSSFFAKLCWKCFPSTLIRKANVFDLIRFEERFQEAPFTWRISVDGVLEHILTQNNYIDSLLWTVNATKQLLHKNEIFIETQSTNHTFFQSKDYLTVMHGLINIA